jgi:protein PhnA
MIKVMETKDSAGNILNDGDTVIVSKTLKVKGISKPLKEVIRLKIFALLVILKI